MLIKYILYPILGILLILIGIIVARKNKLLKNKRLILFILLSMILLCVPVLLALLDYNFMPYGYILSAFIYLFFGLIALPIVKWVKKNKSEFLFEIILLSFLMLIAMIAYGFLFNLFNELNYGFWASTSLILFILPSFFRKTFLAFTDIPAEIHKVWDYNKSKKFEGYDYIDYNKLQVIQLELFKKQSDSGPITINAKAPEDIPLGMWFKQVLMDYNKKSPSEPIVYQTQGDEEGWIFYIKESFFKSRNYIDYDKTFKENKIGERYKIVAKRVELYKIDEE
ncbi:TssN family type VI secretion system protein [Marinilabilia salmonicolor]|uniref:TssN family type VI secretion system protein n=1 Tax=Marinilabilia salmonicolor TaxID=989 RepID=UPI00029AD8AA|nr:TssN family type VI secretion system protein [Marinilabilia salmonicolor]